MKFNHNYSSRFRILSKGRVVLAIAIVSANLLYASPAQDALPTNPVIVSGNIGMSSSAPNNLTINQSTNQGIINWGTFNIGSAASVQFNQPNVSSSTLNRVVGGEMSQIAGSLNANGKVILINPNGVIFQNGSRVDVGGIIASTLNLSDADYLNNNYIFTRDGATGKVLNYGEITARDKGFVALLAPEVINEGVVAALAGSVVFAAGEKVTLDFAGDGLLHVEVDPSTIDTLIENKHLVMADGGVVYMSTKAASDLQSATISNSGTIKANSLTEVGGKIFLTADTITLEETSVIEAKGAKGGGEVLVGGDWQGSNDVYQATTVTMAQGATIDASATDNGDGGKVVLWSDITKADSKTEVHGSIEAKGGANGGDGGQVETSGRLLEINNATVSTLAPQGKTGDWLLDPGHIAITTDGIVTSITSPYTASGGAVTYIKNSAVTTALASNNLTITTGGGAYNLTLYAPLIWTSGNNLTLEAGGDLFVQGNIDSSGGSGGDISLKAAGNITTQADIAISTSGGKVTFNSDSDANGAGYILLQPRLSVTTSGGAIVMGGGADPLTDYAYGIADTAGVHLNSGVSLSSGGGDIKLNGQSNVTGAGLSMGVYLDSATIDAGSGKIDIKGKVTGSSSANAQAILNRTGTTSTLRSSNTSADAISLIGDASGVLSTAAYSIGINFIGTIEATGTGGGIYIKGTGGVATNSEGAILASSSILAKSGPITLIGANDNVYHGLHLSGVTLGKKTGTNVTSSSADVTLQGQRFFFEGTNSIDTSGTVSVLSVNDSFAIAETWPNLTLSTDVSGLTIGKTTNTSAITIGATSIAGPISIYGGTVNINGNLTSSATGDIFIQASGTTNPPLSLAAGKTISKTDGTGTLTLKSNGRVLLNTGSAITASGGASLNVVLWSDYGNANLGGSSPGNAAITTQGGHVWIGGSNSANGTTTWNGLTVGDGPSDGSPTSNLNALDWSGANITTAGGDVLVWAGNGSGAGGAGIYVHSLSAINSGSGDVTLITDGIDGTGNDSLIVTSTGHLTIAPNGGAYNAGTITLSHDSATNANFGGDLNYLLVNSMASLTGLTIGQYTGTGLVGDSTYTVNNSSVVTLNSPFSIAGPISVYGGQITVNGALSAAGNILLDADLDTTQAFNGDGITVSANISTTNNGNITLLGRGGNTAEDDGVYINNSSVQAGGTGTLSITGIGGTGIDGAGSSNHGIVIDGASAQLSTNNGDITLTGTGGATTAGSYNQGIAMTGGAVFAGGSGSVSLTGTGGSAAVIGQRGVVFTKGSVYTAGGALNIIGSSGASGSDNSDGITLGSAGTVTIGNASSGAISLTGIGGGGTGSEGISTFATTTIGHASHSAGTTINANTVSIDASTSFLGSGILTIAPTTASTTIGLAGGAGTLALSASNFTTNFVDGFSNIIIGRSDGTGKITSAALTASDNLTLLNTTGGIELTGAVNVGANTLTLNSTGSVSDTGSGAITASSLALLGTGGSFVLDSVSNNVGTLSANTASINYTDADALSIGTIGATTGITTTGTTEVATKTGDLTVAQNVSATSVILNAGKDTAAGTSTGGDIIISGSPTVTATSGTANAKLYSGSISGSTGLTTLIGSGSGKFRYNADENTDFLTASWTDLGTTGTYAIYREQPTASVTVGDQSITYGGTVATVTGTITGTVNGDTPTYGVSSPLYSTSNNIKAGSYTLTATGLSALGYNISGGSNGTLTVNTKTLTLSGFDASSKTYDGTTTATIANAGSLSGLVTNDVVTVSNTGATFDTKNVGTAKTVTLAGVAIAGADKDNYTIANTATDTANISALGITLTADAKSKTYGDADVALTYTNTALIGGDSITGALSRTSGEDAGLYAINQNTLAISDGNSGNNYSITYVGNNLTIDKRDITLAATAATKIYGDTDPALAATITGGSLGSVSVSDTLADVTGTLTRETGENVGVYDIALGTGTKASNYTITYVTDNNDFSITPKALTLQGSTGISKIYDGKTNMPTGVNGYGSLSGIVGSDSVSVTGATAFDSANAGARTIQQGSVLLSGAEAGNYTLNWTDGSGTIDKATITVIADNDARFYSKTETAAAAANYAGVSYSGFVNGETSATAGLAGTLAVVRTGLTGDGSTDAAGTYTLTPSGLSASNYAITHQTGTYTIVPAGQLLVKVTDVANTYGTATTYDVSSAEYMTGTTVTSLGDPAAGNTVTVDGVTFTLSPTSASSSTAGFVNVGSYQLGGTVTAGSTANFSNTLVVVGNHTVAQKSLSASVSGISKTYDGTTAMAGVTIGLTGKETNDVVTVSGNGAFDTKTAGINKNYNISGIALSGTDSANYYLTGGNSFTGSDGTINTKVLNVTYTAANKVYDGTTNATVTTSDDKIAGDTVSIVHTDAFSDKNVGTGKTVNITGISLSGADAANYTIAATDTTTANISALGITLTADAKSKTYGDADVALTYTNTALIGGDSITGALSRTSGEDAGLYAINQNTLAISDGNSGNNYSITYVGNNLTIDKRDITLAATAATKIYGDTDPALAATITGGSLGSVSVSDTLADVTGTLTRETGENVGVYDIALGTGTKASNYTITYVTDNNDFSITPKALTLQGSTGISKIYDGKTNMPTGVNGYGSLSGIVGSDSVSVTGATAFDSANAGARTIQQGSVLLSGAEAGNYTLNWTDGSGTIDKATITVIADNDARFYSKTETAAAAANYAGVSYSGFVNGETSATAGLAGTLAVVRTGLTGDGSTDAAGTYTLTPSGLSASNYAITHQTGTYTIVPAGQLLVKVTDVANTYGTATTYDVSSAEYMTGTTVTSLGDPAAGNTVTVDGVTFTLSPTSASSSTAGFVNVGSYQLGGTVTAGSTANFSNTLVVVGNHTVAQKSLSASVSGISKTYDGTTAMAGVTIGLTGKETNDVVTVSGNGAFDTKTAGINKNYNISGIALSGTDSANYYLTGGNSFTGSDGTINTKVLNVTYTAANKVYDGTTNATVTTSDDKIAGDTVSIVHTDAFSDKNVGTGKTVNITGISLSGADSANYTVTATSTTTADITKKALSITAATTANKVYDGATTSTTTAGTLSGFVGSETLTTTVVGTFDTKDVGTTKTVTDVYTLVDGTNGGLASNYSLADTTSTADITALVSAPVTESIVIPVIPTPPQPIATNGSVISPDIGESIPVTDVNTQTGEVQVSSGGETVTRSGVSTATAVEPQSDSKVSFDGLTVGNTQSGTEIKAIIIEGSATSPVPITMLVTVKAGEGFSFAIPQSAVAQVIQSISQDSNTKVTSVTATLSDGKDLPSWITFDKNSMSFNSTNVPAGSLPITVTVTIETDDGSKMIEIIIK